MFMVHHINKESLHFISFIVILPVGNRHQNRKQMTTSSPLTNESRSPVTPVLRGKAFIYSELLNFFVFD